MKKYIILLLAIIALTSCEKQLDMTVCQKQMFVDDTSIHAVEIDDAWKVDILITEDSPRLELQYSAFLEEFFDISKNGDVLKIGLSQRLNLPSNTVMDAVLYVNSLHGISASKAADIQLIGTMEAPEISLNLDAASTLKGGTLRGNVDLVLDNASSLASLAIESENCSISVLNASTFKGSIIASSQIHATLKDASRLITYGGQTPSAFIALESASFLNMTSIEVTSMTVNLKEASEANVFVTTSLSGCLRDASRLFYQGHPTLDMDSDITSSYGPI